MAPIRDIEQRVDNVERLAERHEWELHGDRGLFPWTESIEERMKWINRALWTIAVSIIGAAVAIILAGGGPT